MVKKKTKKVVEKQEPVSAKSKMKVNYWMVATAVLALLLLINGLVAMTSGISKKTAEQEFLNFAQAQGADIQVLGVKSVGDLYEISFDFQGQPGEFHITKDGKYLGQMMPLGPTQAPVTGQAVQETQQASAYSVEDQAKLQEFNQCLAEAGVKVYGANWCGWTQRIIETLGGRNAIDPIYIECTEDQSICDNAWDSANVPASDRGYPSIIINNERYAGDRTVEAFAQVTGCPVPQLEGFVAQATTEASC